MKKTNSGQRSAAATEVAAAAAVQKAQQQQQQQHMAISKPEIALLVRSYLRDENFSDTFRCFEKECADKKIFHNMDTSHGVRNLGELLSEYITIKQEQARRDQFLHDFCSPMQPHTRTMSLFVMRSVMEMLEVFSKSLGGELKNQTGLTAMAGSPDPSVGQALQALYAQQVSSNLSNLNNSTAQQVTPTTGLPNNPVNAPMNLQMAAASSKRKTSSKAKTGKLSSSTSTSSKVASSAAGAKHRAQQQQNSSGIVLASGEQMVNPATVTASAPGNHRIAAALPAKFDDLSGTSSDNDKLLPVIQQQMKKTNTKGSAAPDNPTLVKQELGSRSTLPLPAPMPPRDHKNLRKQVEPPRTPVQKRTSLDSMFSPIIVESPHFNKIYKKLISDQSLQQKIAQRINESLNSEDGKDDLFSNEIGGNSSSSSSSNNGNNVHYPIDSDNIKLDRTPQNRRLSGDHGNSMNTISPNSFMLSLQFMDEVMHSVDPEVSHLINDISGNHASDDLLDQLMRQTSDGGGVYHDMIPNSASSSDTGSISPPSDPLQFTPSNSMHARGRAKRRRSTPRNQQRKGTRVNKRRRRSEEMQDFSSSLQGLDTHQDNGDADLLDLPSDVSDMLGAHAHGNLEGQPRTLNNDATRFSIDDFLDF